MLAVFASIAAQSTGMITASPPPPPVIVALEPSSQSGITFSGRPTPGADVPAPYSVDVTISVEGRTLWKGTLRLARTYSASYNQTVQEAPAEICPGMRSYEATQRTNFGIGLNSQFTENQERINVNFSWVRPQPAKSCGSSGSRTVQINETVPLKNGETVTLTGDAGLVLTLSRR